mmetsp:Transcript_701/g.817  ORF Transcript_701/g.817 Transcript_701/m.817 type:complete len:289 (+) Transcript_701:51-917(+)
MQRTATVSPTPWRVRETEESCSLAVAKLLLNGAGTLLNGSDKLLVGGRSLGLCELSSKLGHLFVVDGAEGILLLLVPLLNHLLDAHVHDVVLETVDASANNLGIDAEVSDEALALVDVVVLQVLLDSLLCVGRVSGVCDDAHMHLVERLPASKLEVLLDADDVVELVGLSKLLKKHAGLEADVQHLLERSLLLEHNHEVLLLGLLPHLLQLRADSGKSVVLDRSPEEDLHHVGRGATNRTGKLPLLEVHIGVGSSGGSKHAGEGGEAKGRGDRTAREHSSGTGEEGGH